jgi:hypothetical protein
MNTVTLTHALNDGTTVEISVSLRVTRSPDGHLEVVVADAESDAPTAAVSTQATATNKARRATETDAQYLQRLVELGEAEPRILSRWAKLLKTSYRKLVEEKKAGRINFVEKGHTRAGNAHLVSVEEMIKAVERLARDA